MRSRGDNAAVSLQRGAGILLPLAALPSDYGIGSMGKNACEFIDFLKAAGQKYWQLLPLCPAGPGASPYSSVSSFAGNPWYIDPDKLAEDGIISAAELPEKRPAGFIDYGFIAQSRETMLRRAFERSGHSCAQAVEKFRRDNPWLEGYALYMALKTRFDGKPWYQWPEDIKRREPAAVEYWHGELEEEIRYNSFVQYLFYSQWGPAKEYAGKNGVSIIGDVPIYAAMDSADLWLEPRFFRLDASLNPAETAGVPPDYYCEDGQLWGNPLYDWDAMRADGWGWWIRRMDGASRLFDVVRIDHFRAFASCWAVPAGEKTAKNGHWIKGPGMELLGTLINWFSGMKFIAEDLGILSPDVGELLKASGLPGMKVLEFAFSPEGDSVYLPHKYERNCVCYAGTHDNNTVLGWLEDISAPERAFAAKYMGVSEKEGWCRAMLRCGMESVADVFIAQMQDILEKPGECRTNTPGTAHGNWRWRLSEGECTPKLADTLREYTKMYGRL